MKATKSKILIADDEENARIVLSRALELLGYQVESVTDGAQAIQHLAIESYDVLLLDLRMPEVNGMQVMEYVKQSCSGLAVIVLTAHATLDSAITAVKAGVSDYLLKPQRIAEIDRSIQRAIQSRSGERQRQRLISIMEKTLHELQSPDDRTPEKVGVAIQPGFDHPEISLDFEQRRLLVNPGGEIESRTVDLTKDQTSILAFMADHPGKALSNREIATMALGYHDLSEKEAEQIVRPHILRIRRKIETDPCHPLFIRTVRGIGYSFYSIIPSV